MKLVVTILQNRRVSLPYLFLEHALPRMRATWPGDVESVLVQHRADAASANSRFGSLQGSARGQNEALERVRRWTDVDGRYDSADEVLVHTEVYRPYPSLPSVRLAVEAALARGAEFHLMIEDDAIVCDEECGDWPAYFGPSEVGVYRYYHYINSAFVVMRPRFLERILPGLRDAERWGARSRLERFLFRNLRTTRTHLNPAAAVRAHPREFPYTGAGYVADFVRRLAPADAHLLDIDFGEGAGAVATPSIAEMRAHAALDNARWSNKLLQTSVRAGEELWKHLEGRDRRGPYDSGWETVIEEERARRQERNDA